MKLFQRICMLFRTMNEVFRNCSTLKLNLYFIKKKKKKKKTNRFIREI